ncbi:dnaJ protein ERDJ7 [Humulus lupulus]|uniref:dnaJ protein ERDJ7 n=1 Tax=Humulus lupulus TaxID=3486 RepID=UPI002B4110C1|nr:dnaJ protein ERDJ7 [Humulus lupulus]
MQSHLFVGPISVAANSNTSAASFSHRRRRKWRTSLIVASSSSSSSYSSPSYDQNHYAVLGLDLSASSSDIKRAYRLLARKYHPDVSKDSQASELFKTIRCAYEVLSNEVTRIQYDRALKFREHTSRQNRRQRNYSSEFDSEVRVNRWNELRQRIQRERYWKEKSSSFNETNGVSDERSSIHERGPFTEVLRSAFISLFLLHTFGSRLSLTFSSLMALFDRKLDAGYKIGYVIAWVLGGKGGILLTLSLSFASWACGKTSSSIVALVVVAMWVGSNLARYAPLPQGALLTLLYMSIKLQADLK